MDPSPADEMTLTHPEDSLDEMIIPVAVSLLFIDYLGLFRHETEFITWLKLDEINVMFIISRHKSTAHCSLCCTL